MSDPDALRRLETLLADCCMEVAEMMRDADEQRDVTYRRAQDLHRRMNTLSRMAGLGDLPEMRIERKVRLAS